MLKQIKPAILFICIHFCTGPTLFSQQAMQDGSFSYSYPIRLPPGEREYSQALPWYIIRIMGTGSVGSAGLWQVFLSFPGTDLMLSLLRIQVQIIFHTMIIFSMQDRDLS